MTEFGCGKITSHSAQIMSWQVAYSLPNMMVIFVIVSEIWPNLLLLYKYILKNVIYYGCHGKKVWTEINTCQNDIIWIPGCHLMIFWKRHENFVFPPKLERHIWSDTPAHNWGIPQATNSAISCWSADVRLLTSECDDSLSGNTAITFIMSAR